jgi:hypothetical protein
MNLPYKKIELLTNLAILVVAVLLGVVLVRRYLLPGGGAVAPRADLRVAAGTKIPLPDVDWARNGHTLVLVLSRDCHFCTESAPFYRRLVNETAGRQDLHLVAVLPQDVEAARKYLEDEGVAIGDVRQAPVRSVGAQVTPTLILVDGAGAAQDSWVGKLEAPKEDEVLGRLKGDRAVGGRRLPQPAQSLAAR